MATLKYRTDKVADDDPADTASPTVAHGTRSWTSYWAAASAASILLLLLTLRSTTCAVHVTQRVSGEVLGHLFRDLVEGPGAAPPLGGSTPQWLDGTTVYRVVPGRFPQGMGYHFDGLSVAMSFTFAAGELRYAARRFDSLLARDYAHCLFLGTGTGPTAGYRLCWQNPAVNLLPLHDQLWLTVDSAFWGRIDPQTLATLPEKVNTTDLVLNAHPACDPGTGECYVEYACSSVHRAPYTAQACIAQLVHQGATLRTEVLQRVTLPRALLIQHSHSLCLTPNYVVVKVDAFEPRPSCPDFPLAGMLKVVHQAELNLWLVMHRRTHETRIMTSGNHSFINNHFWNCYERDGAVVAESVPATGDYLDAYFADNLKRPLHWDRLLYPPLRCTVPFAGVEVTCGPMLKDPGVLFDYPTYNPKTKMSPAYRWVYGVSVAGPESRFFDSLIKVDARSGELARRWDAGDVYITEADFIPRPGATAEDDGLLFTVGYNSTEDRSAVYLLRPTDMRPMAVYPLDRVVPFHAHGVVCAGSPRRCFFNP